MGSAVSISSRTSLDVVNETIQTAQANCEISCDQDLSGTTVIIGNGSKAGNIDFTQTCVIANSACMIRQTLDTSIENILSAIAEQESLSSKPIMSMSAEMVVQDTQIEETIRNRVLQLIASTCTFNTNQVLTDTYVYVGDGSSVGNLSFAQNSTISNVECSVDAIAKSVIFNQASAESRQKTKIVDAVTMIVVLVALVLLMGFFLVLVFLLTGSR